VRPGTRGNRAVRRRLTKPSLRDSAAAGAAARSIGQRGRPTALQRRPTHTYLTRHMHPPVNPPAAANAPRSDPYTPLRIEPLPDVRAPKGFNLIRATTALTQRACDSSQSHNASVCSGNCVAHRPRRCAQRFIAALPARPSARSAGVMTATQGHFRAHRRTPAAPTHARRRRGPRSGVRPASRATRRCGAR
jgi:hypothetical protein